VDAAVKKAMAAPPGTFCLGQLVHSRAVSDTLSQHGIVTVQTLTEVPDDATVIIRAHGVTPAIYDECQRRSVTIIDATCPYVSIIQKRAKLYCELGYHIVLVGDALHPEIIGINGWCNGSATITDGKTPVDVSNYDKVLVMFQTTFDIDFYEESLQNIFTEGVKTLEIFNTICYTTIDRQNYAHFVAKRSDLVVVVGDRNSSNTKKLYEIASRNGKDVAWIDENVPEIDLSKYNTISFLSGASTPKELMKGVLSRMSNIAQDSIEVVNEEVAEVKAEQPAEEIATEVVAEVPAEQPAEVVEVAEVAAEPAAEVAAPAEEVVAPVTAEAVAEAPIEAAPAKEETLFEKAVNKLENSRYRLGQKVKAVVSAKPDDGLFVRLTSWKQDAFVPNEEIALEDWQAAKDQLKVGDTLEAAIRTIENGKITLSKKAIDERYKDDQLIDGIKNGDKFEVTITKVGKDSLIGRLGSYTVIVHASQIKMGFEKNLPQYVGKKLTLTSSADKINDEKHLISASHKAILLAERKEKEDAFWNNIEVNEIVEGKVVRFASFGAFVSVRDVDCLAHTSDLSWERIASPSEVLEIGKTYEFAVLALDREKNRVSLGYKQLQPKPWELASDKFTVGSVVKGKVARIMPFGAFVQLENHIDGLLHISNVSWDWLEDINQAIKVGDEIDVQILEFDADNKRITLSRKAVMPRPEAAPAEEPSDAE
jgi:4-hydroxy-3-methylbut-2-enyl diphosphate reductase